MAETLGVSEQTIKSYKVVRRRIPVFALPTLATALTISIEEVLGKTVKLLVKSSITAVIINFRW